MFTHSLPPDYRREDAAQIVKDGNGRVVFRSSPGARSNHFLVYPDQEPFTDVRVRRALFLGVDRRNVVDSFYCTQDFGCGAVLGTFFPPGMVEDPGALDDVPGYRVPKDQDIAEAKALLVEAGYPDGLGIDVNISSRQLHSNGIWSAIADQLKKDLGIDLTLNSAQGSTFVFRMEGMFPLSQSRVSIEFPDSSDVLNQFYAKDIPHNPTNWSDPRLDKIIESQAREVDPEKRLALFEEAVEFLRKGEGHMIPVLWEEAGGLMDYRLQNVHIPATPDIIHKWDHVWWDPHRQVPGRWRVPIEIGVRMLKSLSPAGFSNQSQHPKHN